MAFDAFISYSHAADGRLAPTLQHELQRFAKPWWRRRALRVFRDESVLTVSPDLWASITEALDSAGWFVLLASPEAAESEWVDREIRYWREHKDVARILPVVTDGTWVWNSTRRDFDPGSTAVPEALRNAFPAEPRHLDLRWVQHGSALDPRNGQFLDAVVQLAAPMHAMSKDDLIGEDVRIHRRNRRVLNSMIASLVGLAVTAGVLAVRANDAATRSEASAVEAQLARDQAQASGQQARQTAARLGLRVVAARLEAQVRAFRSTIPAILGTAPDEAECVSSQAAEETKGVPWGGTSDADVVAQWLAIPAIASACFDPTTRVGVLLLLETTADERSCLTADLIASPEAVTYLRAYLGVGSEALSAAAPAGIPAWGTALRRCTSVPSLATLAVAFMDRSRTEPGGGVWVDDRRCVRDQVSNMTEDRLDLLRDAAFNDVLGGGRKPHETTWGREIQLELSARCAPAVN